MNTATFRSKLLSDGHLYCPKGFAQKNALFKVIVIFEDTETKTSEHGTETEASEHDIELSAIYDNSTDFLSKEELSYYLNLEEL